MPFANYDDEIRNILPYYDSFHQETINLVKAVNPDPRIWLDTGCGTGTLAERALKHFPNTRFVLADPLVEMLGKAKMKLSGMDRVIFLKPVFTQDLSIDDIKGIEGNESPDVVTAIQSHHYLSKGDRSKATKVCYDLLNNGGIYITFENIRPFTEIGTEIGILNWKNYQLSRGRDPVVVENHLKRFDAEFFPITIEEHLSTLRDTGFKAVELLWCSCMQAGFYCIK